MVGSAIKPAACCAALRTGGGKRFWPCPPMPKGCKAASGPTIYSASPKAAETLVHAWGGLFHTLPMGPVVIIGADIPGISRAHIARAFAALGNHASVLGPAPDGGFWLIGLKRVSPPPKTLFYGVRWSTAQTMTDTLATLPRPIAMIDTLNDIDTAADLANDLE